ncbi:MAG: response regulator [Chitinophagaceae bacterium]
MDTAGVSQKYRVLAADDDPDILKMISLMLEREGFVVETLLNAVSLDDKILQERPHIILLDIHMHDINGSDLCRELKKSILTRGIPVLIISADDNVKSIAQLCGADGHVSKPFGPKELIEKISGLVKKGN